MKNWSAVLIDCYPCVCTTLPACLGWGGAHGVGEGDINDPLFCQSLVDQKYFEKGVEEVQLVFQKVIKI